MKNEFIYLEWILKSDFCRRPPLPSQISKPFSLASIAKTIRQGINKNPDIDFLNKWIETVDLIMREIIKDDKLNGI